MPACPLTLRAMFMLTQSFPYAFCISAPIRGSSGPQERTTSAVLQDDSIACTQRAVRWSTRQLRVAHPHGRLLAAAGAGAAYAAGSLRPAACVCWAITPALLHL